ncbi:MAG: c-type cytochrome [Planctomycetota bacterium]
MKLRDEIGPDIIRLHERHELPSPARVELQSVFSAPAPITVWRLAGAWPKQQRPEFDPKNPPAADQKFRVEDREFGWKEVSTSDAQGRLDPRDHVNPADGVWALAYAGFESDIEAKAEAVFGSDDQLVVWVNGEQVYDFQGDRGYNAEEAKTRVPLRKGTNHVYVLSGNTSGPWSFSVQIGRRNPQFAFLHQDTPEKLEPAVYAEFALRNKGDAERGKRLFRDVQGVACVKCHAVSGDGGKIGPDLVGLGVKYPRDEIIRSILEPSSRVLASYQVTNIVTMDGDVLSGIIKSETADEIELANADGKVIKIAASEIDTKAKSNVSLMPNGLKDGMTLEDFADIVAYLESLKEAPAEGAVPGAGM